MPRNSPLRPVRFRQGKKALVFGSSGHSGQFVPDIASPSLPGWRQKDFKENSLQIKRTST